MIKPNYELATWVHAARMCLLEDGYDADYIMSQAGLNFDNLKSSTEQIPKELATRVWSSVEEVTRDDSYCLRALAHLSDPFLNALVTSIKASGSVQNALQLIFKYSQVVHPSMNFNASVNQNLCLRMVPCAHESFITTRDIDITFCLFAKLSVELLSSEYRPIRVCLTREEPKSKDEYLSHFDCPVEFLSDENSIEFQVEILNCTIPGYNPDLATHLESYLQEQVESIQEDQQESELNEKVSLAIQKLLPMGTPKISNVAHELGLSVRSLQRKLRESGNSYSIIMSQTRMRLAQSKLKEDDPSSLDSISNELGFTEVSNFLRFFKQHSGLTPSAYSKKYAIKE